MYYQLVDSQGDNRRRAVNLTSLADVKEDLLDLILPQICTEDVQDYKNASMNDLAAAEGYTLEQSETPFPNDEFDFDETDE